MRLLQNVNFFFVIKGAFRETSIEETFISITIAFGRDLHL